MNGNEEKKKLENNDKTEMLYTNNDSTMTNTNKGNENINNASESSNNKNLKIKYSNISNDLLISSFVYNNNNEENTEIYSNTNTPHEDASDYHLKDSKILQCSNKENNKFKGEGIKNKDDSQKNIESLVNDIVIF